jgi:hypothetical protein
MKDDLELPASIQALLDQRRDPLQSPEVQSWLLEHPQHLEQFARMRSFLLADGAPAAPLDQPLPLLRLLLLAAASVLVAFGAVHRCSGPAVATTLPRPDFATTGRIVHFSTCTTVVGPLANVSAGTVTLCSEMTAGAASLQRVDTLTFEPAPSSSVPLCVMVTRAEENQPSCIRP